MNIMVTNDDGIDSPGLWALAEAMSRVGETLVVAPDKEQSGMGTSLSLHSGMSIAEVPSTIRGVRAYATGGTPSDCVIIGLRRLAQGHIGLVISGINPGANVGNDILYSGTVMATLQGYFRKIPSIAMSLVLQNREEEPRFDVVARVAEHLAQRVKSGKMPTEAIINVNVPNIPLEEIKGMVTTRTASSGWGRIADVEGGGSVSYRREVSQPDDPEIGDGTDIHAVQRGLISITPLHIDVTQHNMIPALNEHIVALESELLGTA